jgi:hypothetical protein
MTRSLTLLYAAVFVVMLAVVTWASLQESVWAAGARLMPDPWFVATLADVYFAFMTIWLWVAWRERTWAVRLTWLVLFAVLGNLAIAAYILLALRRLPPGAGVADLLGRPAAPAR